MAEGHSKPINYEFQVFKAICITLICVGHLWNVGFNGPFDLYPVYSFHVAAFAFTSGYFYNARNDEKSLEYIKRKAKTLLIPTLIINVAYGVLAVFLRQHGIEWTDSPEYHQELNFDTLVVLPFISGHQFNLNYAMWYMPSLFFAESFYALMRRTIISRGWKTNVEYLACGLSVVLGGIAIQSGGESGMEPSLMLMMGRSFFLLGFIGIGRLFRLKFEHSELDRPTLLFVVGPVVQLALTYACSGSVKYVPSWLKFPNGAILTYLVSINGILFCLGISKLLAPKIGKNSMVNAIADNTYSIMMHHRLAYFLLCSFFWMISIRIPLFPEFDLELYRTTGSYHYYLGDYSQSVLLYLLAGIAIPIAMHRVYSGIKSNLNNLRK